MKVSIVFEGKRAPFGPDHKGLIQGAEELGLDYQVIDPTMGIKPHVLAAEVRDFKPDLVLHHMTSSLNQGLPELIGKDIKQIYWMLDYHENYRDEWEMWIRQKGYLDHIFLSNYKQLDMWKEAFECPSTYLPHGCYVSESEKDPSQKYNCVFIGGKMYFEPYEKRARLLDNIEKLCPFTTLNANDVEGRNEIWKNMPRIYHSSDTVLDVSHYWDVPGYASGRYFYSAGHGACSITKRFPRCEELYPEGTKIYFDTPEEASNKIKYYILHEKEREEIKKRAYEHNKEFHNYKKRWEKILSV
ncbi:MAG: glycosyltransferase [Candidatus Paceibacterota bacterium]|jgi:hypothetical protein